MKKYQQNLAIAACYAVMILLEVYRHQLGDFLSKSMHPLLDMPLLSFIHTLIALVIIWLYTKGARRNFLIGASVCVVVLIAAWILTVLNKLLSGSNALLFRLAEDSLFLLFSPMPALLACLLVGLLRRPDEKSNKV